LLGALVAISPTFLDASSPQPLGGGGDDGDDEDGVAGSSPKSAWVSNCLYLASNVPMALSAVYKESRFAADDVHPLYLTQWARAAKACSTPI
jgi:hypothetical protein